MEVARYKASFAITAAFAFLWLAGSFASALTAKPQLMIWAWERPENLEFIDSHRVGVSYLALTINLSRKGIMTAPRLQTLEVPKSTYLEGVVHIETESGSAAAFSSAQVDQVARCIQDTVNSLDLHAVQIDFDAKVSERQSYAALLRELRKRLPRNVTLSMTALSSWCLYDYWLADLPVDEIVPMLFSLGADEQKILLLLTRGQDFAADRCKQAIGVSIGGPVMTLAERSSTVAHLFINRRVYVFSTAKWTPESVHAVTTQIETIKKSTDTHKDK